MLISRILLSMAFVFSMHFFLTVHHLPNELFIVNVALGILLTDQKLLNLQVFEV